MSKLEAVLDYVVGAQNALALKVQAKDTTAVKRKLPKKEEDVDLAFQTTISGAEQVDQVRRIAFGSVWQVMYKVEITLITPCDRDALMNLGDHADWREATRAWFMKPGSIAVDGVKRVEIVNAPFLDRPKLAQGYDYNQVVLEVTTYERRS